MRENYNDNFYVRTWPIPSTAPAQYDTYYLVNVIEVKFGIYSYQKAKEQEEPESQTVEQFEVPESELRNGEE